MEFVGRSKRKDGESTVQSIDQRRKGGDGGTINEDDEVGMEGEGEGLVFEDPFGDEFEEEEFEEGAEADDDEDISAIPQDHGDDGATDRRQLWRPGHDPIGEGEELEYDPTAYIMYHSMRTEWPCLSFDIMKDDMGDNRQRVFSSLTSL